LLRPPPLKLTTLLRMRPPQLPFVRPQHEPVVEAAACLPFVAAAVVLNAAAWRVDVSPNLPPRPSLRQSPLPR